MKVIVPSKAMKAIKLKKTMETKAVKLMCSTFKNSADNALDYLVDVAMSAEKAMKALEKNEVCEVHKLLEDVVDYCELVKLEVVGACDHVVD